MTPAQIIVLATPVFLGAIAIELAIGLARGRNTYRLHDAMASIGLGMMSQLVGLFTRLLAIGIYALAYERVRGVAPAHRFARGSGSARC